MLDIDKMPAGRDMDALVAEKVMGLANVCRCELSDFTNDECNSCGGKFREDYSTDIAAAWEVVEKVRLKATLDHIEERGVDPTSRDVCVWVVQFCAKTSNEPWWHEHAYADTVPLAICRAALKCVT